MISEDRSMKGVGVGFRKDAFGKRKVVHARRMEDGRLMDFDLLLYIVVKHREHVHDLVKSKTTPAESVSIWKASFILSREMRLMGLRREGHLAIYSSPTRPE
jgi:hypothetical protein